MTDMIAEDVVGMLLATSFIYSSLELVIFDFSPAHYWALLVRR